MDAIIINGTLPSVAAGLVDETNLLIESLTLSPDREMIMHKGANGAVAATEHRNPTFSLDFKGTTTARTGLPNGHPGNVIAALENFSSSRHGFDPTDGKIIMLDPKTTLSQTRSDEFSFKATQYPFMV
jgi:hypothetical protein